MEDPRWLRLITVGLVLAALAVGYFIWTGRFTSNTTTKVQTQDLQVVPSATPQGSVLGEASQPSASPGPASAYERIVDRNKGEVHTLPKTGFPIGLAVILSISAVISGWSLRKFPH